MRSPCGAANASIASDSDTPSPTDATRGQPPVRDPALDGSRRRPEPLGDLPWAQLIGHRVVSVALVPMKRQRSRALSADEADHDGGCQDDGDRRRQLLDRDPEADMQRDRVRPERPRGLREGRTPGPTGFDVQPRLREGGRRSAGSGARHTQAPRSRRGWRPCRRRRSPGHETRTASSSSPAASVASLGTYAIEGGACRRGVSSHEQGARSLETAGVGIRRIGEPPLRA